MSKASEQRVVEILRDMAERVYAAPSNADPAQFAGVMLRQIDRQAFVDRAELLRVALQAWVIAFYAEKRGEGTREMSSVLGSRPGAA